MRPRQLINRASFGPKELEIIFEAFDGAWDAIAANYTPDEAEAARIQLAKLILGRARDGEMNTAALKLAAIRIMGQPVSETGS